MSCHHTATGAVDDATATGHDHHTPGYAQAEDRAVAQAADDEAQQCASLSHRPAAEIIAAKT